MKERTWLGILLSFAAPCRGKMAASVVLAILSVAGGFAPYLGVYQIIRLFLERQADWEGIVFWCGVCLAAANFVKMMAVDRTLMNNPEVTVPVALVVCLTLMLTVICAKIVGCTLPMAAEKVGIDPAVMAAPFITTVVDALSLLIYFSIATRVLGI